MELLVPIGIIVLLVSILVCAAFTFASWACAASRDAKAGAALVPYALWTGFATALNASIWRRNR